MVSHFHYDPVWWNTQGQFTEARLALPDEDGKTPDVRSAFELVGAHLDKARNDPDYTFVLAELDYLKPYFDAFPQDRKIENFDSHGGEVYPRMAVACKPLPDRKTPLSGRARSSYSQQ